MSLVTGLFFPVLLLNQRWSPPLRLQASHFSTFRITCDFPSIAVFCSESIECFPGTASKFFLKLLVTIPMAPITTGIIAHCRFHIRFITKFGSEICIFWKTVNEKHKVWNIRQKTEIYDYINRRILNVSQKAELLLLIMQRCGLKSEVIPDECRDVLKMGRHARPMTARAVRASSIILPTTGSKVRAE